MFLSRPLMLRRNGPGGSCATGSGRRHARPTERRHPVLDARGTILRTDPGSSLCAVETEPARYLGKITPAVGRVHGIHAMGPELVRLGSIAAVVDDADQQLDPVAPHGLQLLDVLIEAAVAVDPHDLAVFARRGDP